MEVIGLVGGSGTGKSHRAVTLAKEMRIEAIIDDGLLIAGNKIMAGRSAKAEYSRMAAVRRAIFQDETHAAEVRQALAKLAPGKLLILGTSEGMLIRIATALQIPAPSHTVYIEDLASEEEMLLARHLRLDEGTHVIPVANSEVRRLIPVALADVLDNLDNMLRGGKTETRHVERTQVKPYFSSGGSGMPFQLAMVRPLIEQAVQDSGHALYRLNQASLQHKQGLILSLDLAVAQRGFDIHLLKDLQKRVQERVHAATGRRITQVELYISGVLH